MRQFQITTLVTEYASSDELPAGDRALLAAARHAATQAYAPYSNFHVGAAVLLEDGTVVTGNNQENVAYPSGLCAERVAVFAAGAQHPGKTIKAIAVSCRTEAFDANRPLPPCGACRQALSEYEEKQHSPVRVILGGPEGAVQTIDSISQLLPLTFNEKGLKK